MLFRFLYLDKRLRACTDIDRVLQVAPEIYRANRSLILHWKILCNFDSTFGTASTDRCYFCICLCCFVPRSSWPVGRAQALFSPLKNSSFHCSFGYLQLLQSFKVDCIVYTAQLYPITAILTHIWIRHMRITFYTTIAKTMYIESLKFHAFI